MTAFAVVGHVEWGEFAEVPRVPARGDVVHAAGSFEEPGGGGAVSAVQLARLSGGCRLFTAVAQDALGRRCCERLEELGVTVHAGARGGAHRRVFVHLDGAGERSITVLGERIAPRGDDPLPWEALDGAAGAYFTAGDGGALRAARRARVLVATARAAQTLVASDVRLDALVRSAHDPGEGLDPATLPIAPRVVISTRGGEGGEWRAEDGSTGTWPASPLPGPVVDAFGCGDWFAAGLTYGLGSGMRLEDAVALAARCGAACLAGRGPYGAA